MIITEYVRRGGGGQDFRFVFGKIKVVSKREKTSCDERS